MEAFRCDGGLRYWREMVMGEYAGLGDWGVNELQFAVSESQAQLYE